MGRHGAPWAPTRFRREGGANDNGLLSSIAVNPNNPNIIYIGTVGGGVWRSDDGGLNWTPGGNGFGDARSLQLDASTPANARILYAGISGRGAFRSNDGGQNWIQILSGSTPVVAAAIGAAPHGFSKVIVSLAPPTKPVANPGGIRVLYVSLEGTGGASDPVGIFMSTNQGGTWVQQTAAGMPTRTQGGYSFHFAVDPGSPGDGISGIIYFGAVGQAVSTDSGNTFTNITGLHADTHAWAFVPQPSPPISVVYCGNDGGLDKFDPITFTWSHLSSGGLQTSLFYNIDIRNDATTLAQVYGSSGFWSPAPCTRVHRSTDAGLTFPTGITPPKNETNPSPIARAPKVGRNHPCPCGSGKKFKRCCNV